MIGKKISHYKIIEKLGEGGMGEVYRAEDLKLKRNVAIKFLPVHLTKDKENVERFKREAQAAAALNHPNIVTIYEIAEEDDQTFIVMEYVDGKSLREVINEYKLGLDKIIDILSQISEGLLQAHKAGIVHRDIKPENIIVGRDARIRILDFGLAKLKGVSKLTKETSTLGTIHYMSPEQLQGKEVDHRSDIWSLGVVLYELLTGEPPFKGEYESAVTYFILNETPERITKLRSDVSKDLERLISKCLEKYPSDRYQNINELLLDIKCVQKESESVKVEEPPPKVKPQKKKLIYLYSSLALFVLIALLIGIYIFPREVDLIDSIAVLPLQSLSDDPEQEYFADGMSDALIAELSKIKALRVISWTSTRQYKNAQKPLSDIAKELNVDAVIEGTVLCAGNEVRITVQLVKTKPEQHLWAENYHRDYGNILILQSEVAQDIANQIRINLTAEDQRRMVTTKVVEPEAYELYLRGRHFRIQQTDESLQRALEYFKQAIAKDSTFAPAYAGLAKIYRLRRSTTVDAKSKMKKAIKKALGLDDTLPEAYMGLGDILEFEFDWAGAENAYKKAIELSPGNSEAHFEYGWLLLRTGRLEEGLMEMKQSLELDPLSLLAHHGAAFAYYYNREYDKSIKYSLMALELDGNYRMAYICLVIAYTAKNEFDRALDALDKMSGDTFFAGVLYAKMGKREEALKYVQKVSDSVKGLIYSAFGEKDEAFFWIDKAIVEKEPLLWMLKIDPNFDNLRSDPRYEELLRKIGLEP